MADCAGLATKGDIENIYALIAQLGDKIPDNLATKEDIAGISSQLAQINQRLSSIENKQAQQDQDLANIKNSQLAIQNDVGGLPSWISNAIEGIKDFFQNMIAGVVNAIDGVFSAVARVSDRLWDKITDAAAFTVEKIGDVFSWVGDRAQWLWERLGDVAGSLGNAISGVFDWIGDRAQWLGDRLWSFSESIADKIRGVYDWITDRIGWLWDSISRALNPISERTSTILNKLNTFDDYFANIQNRVGDIWDSVSSFASRIWDFITDVASSIKNVILRALSAYQEHIENTMRWLYDALAGLFGNPFPYLRSIIEKCDYIIYLLVYGDGSNNSGGGGGENDPINVNLQAIINLINELKADFIKLNNWVCGGLSLSGGSYQLAAVFESNLSGAISSNFNGDLTAGIQRTATNLSELILNYLCVLYGRAGFQDYPISVPALPLTPGAEPLSIVTASRFQSWQTKFIDNGIGAFPFEIRISDSDLIKVGDQELQLKLPNIAETLAEILGLVITSKALGEVNAEIGLRVLGEIGSTKKQGFVSYKLIEAISDYLGFKTKQKKETIKLSYNPLVGVSNGEDNLALALEPTEIDVIVEEEDEKRSLEDQLRILIDAARVIKAVHFRKIGENGLEALKDFFKDVGDDEEETQQAQDEFDTFIEEFEQGFIQRTNMTDNLNPYGRSFDRRPKVRELGDQQDQPTGGA